MPGACDHGRLIADCRSRVSIPRSPIQTHNTSRYSKRGPGKREGSGERERVRVRGGACFMISKHQDKMIEKICEFIVYLELDALPTTVKSSRFPDSKACIVVQQHSIGSRDVFVPQELHRRLSGTTPRVIVVNDHQAANGETWPENG